MLLLLLLSLSLFVIVAVAVMPSLKHNETDTDRHSDTHTQPHTHGHTHTSSTSLRTQFLFSANSESVSAASCKMLICGGSFGLASCMSHYIVPGNGAMTNPCCCLCRRGAQHCPSSARLLSRVWCVYFLFLWSLRELQVA